MSSQPIIEVRQQMIRETEDFLDRELDRPQENGVFYPRMQMNPPTFDSGHRSFTSRDRYYPHLQVKPSRLHMP